MLFNTGACEKAVFDANHLEREEGDGSRLQMGRTEDRRVASRNFDEGGYTSAQKISLAISIKKKKKKNNRNTKKRKTFFIREPK